MPDSPGLVDFVIGLVNSVLNLPDGQVKFFLQKNCEINSAHQSIKESCFLSFFVIRATALLAFVASVYQVL